MNSCRQKSSKFKVQSSKKNLGIDGGPTLPSSNFELRTSNFASRADAFSLVEMMVVIGIIGLLLAALLPAFSAVRNQARYTQASSQFRALDTGLVSFRAEAALGGALPPSSGDNPKPADRQKIANPQLESAASLIRVSGAHLLVHAMVGAEGLGTPGFKDLNRNGVWWDDTHRKRDEGIYAVGDDGKEQSPRYGGSGYVDDKMKERTQTLKDLASAGKIPNRPQWSTADQDEIAINESLFLDPWDRPILYYKANPVGLRMTGALNKPGIFWQEDNGIITGSKEGVVNDEGLDFGAGKEADAYHELFSAKSPEPTERIEDILTQSEDYAHSFVRFILDPSIKARPTPVQKDSYLLISAGPDARYGTADDVTNWTRKTE